MANKQSDMTPSRDLRHSELAPPVYWRSAPFQALQRFSDEVDRMWDDFGFSRRSAGPLFQNDRFRGWEPAIEVSHKNGVVTITADLPGLKRDEVSVELGDRSVTIQGERKREQEEESDGVVRSERSYGSFLRVVPLPESAKTDQAKARFRDGVLEITVPAPMTAKGRRLAIDDGSEPTNPRA
jgi:HSP20 family protein